MAIEPAATVSAGGSCRLLPAADHRWVAMNLARRADLELLAAWMQRTWDGPVWDAVADALRDQPAEAAVERAQLLGIPAAVAVPPQAPSRGVTQLSGPARPTPGLVVDLSTLWAGPLCARLVGAVTRRPVGKGEDPGRPAGPASTTSRPTKKSGPVFTDPLSPFGKLRSRPGYRARCT